MAVPSSQESRIMVRVWPDVPKTGCSCILARGRQAKASTGLGLSISKSWRKEIGRVFRLLETADGTTFILGSLTENPASILSGQRRPCLHGADRLRLPRCVLASKDIRNDVKTANFGRATDHSSCPSASAPHKVPRAGRIRCWPARVGFSSVSFKFRQIFRLPNLTVPFRAITCWGNSMASCADRFSNRNQDRQWFLSRIGED